MIYCLDEEYYPSKEESIEVISYFDGNDFEWRISRTEEGFFVKYFGWEYFAPKTFNFYLKTNKIEKFLNIKNTNCIFVKDIEFDSFYDFVSTVKQSSDSDTVFELIEEMFKKRFVSGSLLLQSEFTEQIPSIEDVNTFLKSLFKDGFDGETEWSMFLEIIKSSQNITLESLQKDIVVGMKNGYSVSYQYSLLRDILKKLM